MPNSNVEKLEAAGVIVNTPLPEHYSRVFESLTEFEMDVILSLKSRLDSAVQEVAGLDESTKDFYGFVAL
jgi:hypothetical protein